MGSTESRPTGRTFHPVVVVSLLLESLITETRRPEAERALKSMDNSALRA